MPAPRCVCSRDVDGETDDMSTQSNMLMNGVLVQDYRCPEQNIAVTSSPTITIDMSFSFSFLVKQLCCLYKVVVRCLWTCSEPPTALSLCEHWCTVGVLPGTHQCASHAQAGFHRGQSANSCVIVLSVLRVACLKHSFLTETGIGP